MTDIVTRLRGRITVVEHGQSKMMVDSLPICIEAADAIEYLQGYCAELRKVITQLVLERDRAVRGE